MWQNAHTQTASLTGIVNHNHIDWQWFQWTHYNCVAITAAVPKTWMQLSTICCEFFFNSMDTLLLDGDCGLCNRGAMFLQPRISPSKSLRILAIESEEGKKLISTLSEKQQNADTVYLFKNGKSYIRSAAIVRLSNYLRWWWRPMAFSWLIPLPIRDVVYRFIAKRRMRSSSAPDHCTF